jgi:hypothetical protein
VAEALSLPAAPSPAVAAGAEMARAPYPSAGPLPLPSTAAALAALLLAAACATAAPLLSYTASLALFGGAHVLFELRYVEARFGDGPLRRLALGVGLALAGVVGLRAAGALGLWGGAPAAQLELALIAALAVMCAPALRGLPARWALPLGLGLAALCAGLLLDPLLTMVCLAVLHNWTPAAFLAEALPAADRRRGRALGLLAFVGLPLLIASGLPGAALTALHPAAAAALFGATLPGAGPLTAHIGVYLPRALQAAPEAPALFAAVTFAQLVHYLVVIGLLPRLAPGGPGWPAPVGLSRPGPRAFALAVAALSLAAAAGYLADFTLARRWYGVIAAVHAWIEVPALLLALGARARPPLPTR